MVKVSGARRCQNQVIPLALTSWVKIACPFEQNSQNWPKFYISVQISAPAWKKSTPPSVVAVVTIMRYGGEQSPYLEIVSLCFLVKTQRQLTKIFKNSDNEQSTDRPPTGIRRRHRQLGSSQPELPIFLVRIFLQFELSGLFYLVQFSISIVFFFVICKFF